MWILLVPAAFFLYNLITTGYTGVNLLINPVGYKFKNGKLVIMYLFRNKVSFEIKLNYIFLDIYADTTLIGQVVMEKLEDTFIIPGDSSRTFEIEVKPLVISIITKAISAALLGQKMPSIRVVGSIKANGLRTPYQVENILDYQA